VIIVAGAETMTERHEESITFLLTGLKTNHPSAEEGEHQLEGSVIRTGQIYYDRSSTAAMVGTPINPYGRVYHVPHTMATRGEQRKTLQGSIGCSCN